MPGISGRFGIAGIAGMPGIPVCIRFITDCQPLGSANFRVGHLRDPVGGRALGLVVAVGLLHLGDPPVLFWFSAAGEGGAVRRPDGAGRCLMLGSLVILVLGLAFDAHSSGRMVVRDADDGDHRGNGGRWHYDVFPLRCATDADYFVHRRQRPAQTPAAAGNAGEAGGDAGAAGGCRSRSGDIRGDFGGDFRGYIRLTQRPATQFGRIQTSEAMRPVTRSRR